ncbi:YgdI/YgdR family lipoprotein [Acinetobacter haemolyticus]|uniref:YgdI/YgdR family lipoprotein n=1 Tax=Acinetobacter haemolyticus TaxID=29430 RepID=UPI001D1939E7|nr:YgdI/YgdR family lipoprotein [Acinetobacter haemolyticus]
MKKISLYLCILFTLGLSGCAVHTPHGSVVIDPDHPDYGRYGDFCPPGQAKKGRC